MRVAADPLEFLFSLEQFGIKFGLANMRALVDAFGRPDRSFRALHIAGTNGKGSVTAMAEAALRAGGYRTGRYTSPHLVDLNERFAIDGQPVSSAALTEVVTDLRTIVDRLLAAGDLQAPPTFFEATTVVAFELFRRARVEVAVCEVGLGGRLDATNVLEPIACAITSIGFDHQQYLGSTLGEIAAEKAGIIKPGVPVVVGRMDREARQTIAAVASERGAPLADTAADTSATVGADGGLRIRTPVSEYGPIHLPLAGAHQAGNACVAVRLLEVAAGRGLPLTADTIVRGLERVEWPGRLEHRRMAGGREILLDAAHNPDGAATLAAFLRTTDWKGAPLVFAAMADKDVDGILRVLLPHVGHLVSTCASNARSADPFALAERARALDSSIRVTTEASPAAALAAAWRVSNRIVVAGSIFLIGDVIKVLESGEAGTT